MSNLAPQTTPAARARAPFWAGWRAAWRVELPVTLIRADARRETWWFDGTTARSTDTRGASARASVAVELPESLLLRRTVRLPRLSVAERAEALALQAQSSSPFSSDDLDWVAAARSRDEGAGGVDLVLASRRQVAAYLAERREALNLAAEPLAWVSAADGGMAPMGTSGRARFSGALRRRRLLLAGSGILAIGFATALAVTPSLKLRQRSIEAQTAFAMLQRQTADVQQQRQQLLKLTDRTKALTEQTATAINGAGVLLALTQMLADDTALVNLSVQGSKVNIYGMTPNAATLMQTLATTPGVQDVKAPQAAIRAAGNAKDTFNIDFQRPDNLWRWVEPAKTAAALQASAASAPAPATPASASALALGTASAASSAVSGRRP